MIFLVIFVTNQIFIFNSFFSEINIIQKKREEIELQL